MELNLLKWVLENIKLNNALQSINKERIKFV